MANKLVFTLIAVASLGLVGSVSGCAAEAHLGNTDPKPPEPPPPPAPVAVAPPPAPVPPAPEPAKKPVLNLGGKAKLEGNKVKIPGELEFDVDKATLKETPQSKEILSTLTDFMKQNPQVTKLRIEGHTDNTGKQDHNQTLSQQRADAVVDYLSKQGIDKSRLQPVGFGQTKPLFDNDTADHKAQNRRTEFHVAEIDGKAQDSASTPAAPSTTTTTASTTTTVSTPAPTATGTVAPGATVTKTSTTTTKTVTPAAAPKK